MLYVSVLCIFICGVSVCAFWITLEAISYALGMGDFDPSLDDIFGTLMVISVIVILFTVTLGPSLTKVTLTFDGRLIGMRFPGGLFSRDITIRLGEVISVVRHEPRGNLNLRRIFGAFNPAKPGVLIKTAQQTYSVNNEEFDKFAEVIKKYKPEVEISG